MTKVYSKLGPFAMLTEKKMRLVVERGDKIADKVQMSYSVPLSNLNKKIKLQCLC